MEPATILWLIGFLVICLLGSIACLLVYSGLLESIEIRAGPPKFGTLTIAYKYAQGEYRNAGQLFTEVHNYVPDLKTIGLYYDDPSEVAPCDLRYAIGAIIAESDIDVDGDGGDVYAAKAPELPEAKLLIEKGYKLAKLPSVRHAVMAQFPFKNRVSVFMAVARVYPKMSEYIKERNLCAHPVIEIYDNDVIHFVAPLAKQNEFYVPEAKEINDDVAEFEAEGSLWKAHVRDSCGSMDDADDGHAETDVATDISADPPTEAASSTVEPSNDHGEEDNAGTEHGEAVEKQSKRSDSNASVSGESSSSFEELNPEAEK